MPYWNQCLATTTLASTNPFLSSQVSPVFNGVFEGSGAARRWSLKAISCDILLVFFVSTRFYQKELSSSSERTIIALMRILLVLRGEFNQLRWKSFPIVKPNLLSLSLFLCLN